MRPCAPLCLTLGLVPAGRLGLALAGPAASRTGHGRFARPQGAAPAIAELGHFVGIGKGMLGESRQVLVDPQTEHHSVVHIERCGVMMVEKSTSEARDLTGESPFERSDTLLEARSDTAMQHASVLYRRARLIDGPTQAGEARERAATTLDRRAVSPASLQQVVSS